MLTMILGSFVLAELRKLKAGQDRGGQRHKSKAGTPPWAASFILGAGVTFAWVGSC
ncbi:MAG: hypothetical protein ACLVBB_07160 [Dysosmobacter welbionis]